MSRTLSKTIGLALTTAGATFTVLAGTAVMAGPAAAAINGISVTGLSAGKSCSVADGCSIQVETSGGAINSQVEFVVDGNVIGTALPSWNGVATLDWHPATTGLHTIGARHNGSASTITYTVGNGGFSLCSLLKSGSGGSGSAGTGSGGSGSALSGSGDSGSTTGSVGSGSGGTGSGC